MTNENTASWTILYVEDNPANVLLVTKIAEILPGVAVISADSAERGIEMAKDVKPNLILLDINLPGMNGFEALVILRKIEDLRDVPIIAATAASSEEEINKGIEAGFDDYVTKPFDINIFLEKIAAYLK